MLRLTAPLTLVFSIFFLFCQTTRATYLSYPNDFVDANVILAQKWNSSYSAAEATVVEWADELAALGPWSVLDKLVTPPTGDKHDYLSWAPYWWPDCSSVGNTTELAPEEVWKKCTYAPRDGQFNPDRLLVNDTAAFAALADAVLYNSIAWVVTNKSSVYSKNTVNFIKTWFLDDSTKMNPHLNYAQLGRGPNGQTGQHVGVLDLKCFTKIVSGVEILRKGKSPEWTPEVDAGLVAWTNTYTKWLETANIAIEERRATNNHGTFYFNQLAALKILVGDFKGALKVTDDYFQGLYKDQITETGEQPLEALRTHPYHYRAYNLAAMATNARLAKYASPTSDPWNATTIEGATIQTAMDYLMAIPIPKPTDEEYIAVSELYLPIATVASVYGDPDAKYTAFLKAGNGNYVAQPWFLWTQPLWDQDILISTSSSGPVAPSATGTTTSAGNTTSTGKTTSTGRTTSTGNSSSGMRVGSGLSTTIVFLLFSLFASFTM